MFYIKKFIEQCLHPLSINLILLFIGLILLYCRKNRWGRRFTFASFIVFLAVSLPWIPNMLFSPLQNQYPPLKQAPKTVKYIVVLGGGILPIPNIPINNLPSGNSMQRIIEATRLWHQIPHAKILFSGADYYRQFNDGDYMAQLAEILGVPPSAILMENQALDTAKEAIVIKGMIKDTPFILVTSAFHMPRAMQLFERQGMHPIAAPCDFQYVDEQHLLEMFPSLYSISKLDIATHEYLGIMSNKLTGKS